ncbi:MAG TPA: sucrase ferredoxin [Pyrinomonadaceae bacterium]|jgi:hypothetical protein
MSEPFFYCSELSRGFAEKTFGTASVGNVWLLIEYPSWWGPHALHDSTLAPAVKAHLGRFLKTVPRSRLLLIKQERRAQSGAGLAVFVVRSRERNSSIERLSVKSYEQLLEIDLAGAARREPAAENAVASLYLVCTHGRRDKCCAKFGYPLYKNLRASSESVWQSSHVGGDRFAANLVCFPHGLFYAHVTEESAARVMAEYEARRVVLDKYRGRACYSYHVQAGEFFIRRASGLAGLDQLRHLRSERLEETAWRVRFIEADGTRIHEAIVRSALSDFQSYTTCQSTEAKSIRQFVLDDYRAADVRPSASST